MIRQLAAERFEEPVERILAGAVAASGKQFTGDILRMLGLPRKPLAESIDLENGVISGLR